MSLLGLVSLGALLVLAFAAETQCSAESVDLRPALKKLGVGPRVQGGRGTCSVFAMAGALDSAVARCTNGKTPLSVEFLNWAGHHATGRTVDGGFFHEIWHGFEEYGACTESELPYRVAYDPDMKPSEATLQHAAELKQLNLRLHWIKEWDVHTGLKELQFDAVKHALQKGWPVACGMRWPKQEQWSDGVLAMCPADQVFDGHSVLILGFRDDPELPGGGVMLIWNSGGPSRDGALPYEFVRSYANDALWIAADDRNQRPASLETQRRGERRPPAPRGEQLGQEGLAESKSVFLTGERNGGRGQSLHSSSSPLGVGGLPSRPNAQRPTPPSGGGR